MHACVRVCVCVLNTLMGMSVFSFQCLDVLAFGLHSHTQVCTRQCMYTWLPNVRGLCGKDFSKYTTDIFSKL